MSVWLVVEWIDGIPETVKVYGDEEAAQQYIRVLGGKNLAVQRWEVS